MVVVRWLPVVIILVAIFSTIRFVGVQGSSHAGVSYDGRSLIINGQHRILFSGSIHYTRSTPQMWPSLISKAKDGGMDVIQTYVFWNVHEPQQGQFEFSGRADLLKFLKEIQAQGLYVCLRMGPFIESEWNYGGLPFWLHDIPGIVFRSDNKPFKDHMQKFVTKIVNMMKEEKLYASQGGPIILSQIENEYQNVEHAFHEKGPPYVRWAAAMAVSLQTGVPWVMCKQDDAPDPVINACNGMRCGETFAGPNSPNKPSIWTEDWTSFYQVYGGETYMRSAQDIAFHAALFIAKRGSYINYYMYHGGTNFGRTAAAFMITSYYDEAPLDEYGLIRQPTWGHLKELHTAIKSCSKTLLNGANHTFPLGQQQEAYVYRRNSAECTAFLVNNDSKRDVNILFQNISYKLPRKSISILPDCKTITFNTAVVNTQHNTRSVASSQKTNSPNKWEEYKETIMKFDNTILRANTLLDHMGTTKDASDYLWYTLRFEQNSSSAKSVLSVQSHGHALHVYVNGVYAASAHGSYQNTSFTMKSSIDLRKGTNDIAFLSVTVGLPDSGAYLEKKVAGLHSVKIQNKDLTNHLWGYQVGLVGETSQIYTESGTHKVKWDRFGSSANQPLMWYKTTFDAPAGNDPVALNLGSMGKGEVWVNGHSIGRYWVSFLTSNGKPSQTWYHIPRSFLKPTGNLLVLLEEEKGYPPAITVDTVSIKKVCGHVHEHLPAVQLSCPPQRSISKIPFASWGTPSGTCQSYAIGDCHTPNSRAVVEKACIGKRNCSIPQSNQFFGDDPCPGISKALLVDATCT